MRASSVVAALLGCLLASAAIAEGTGLKCKHRVRGHGESLKKIADRYHVDPHALLALNRHRIHDPHWIAPHTALRLPAHVCAAIRKRRAKRRARKHAKKVKKHVPKVEEKEEEHPAPKHPEPAPKKEHKPKHPAPKKEHKPKHPKPAPKKEHKPKHPAPKKEHKPKHPEPAPKHVPKHPEPAPKKDHKSCSYTVKHGDSMWMIGQTYHLSLDELAKLNPHIHDLALIYPGEKINLC